MWIVDQLQAMTIDVCKMPMMDGLVAMADALANVAVEMNLFVAALNTPVLLIVYELSLDFVVV